MSSASLLPDVATVKPDHEDRLTEEQVQRMLELYHKVVLIVVIAVLVEYGTAALIFILAYGGYVNSPLLIQAVFIAGECIMEYTVYVKAGAAFRDDVSFSILCLSVPAWLFPPWLFYLASLAPNYVQVLATAVLAGLSFHTWPASSKEFLRRWRMIPLIGTFVGHAGIPCLLTFLMIASSITHMSMMWGYYRIFKLRSRHLRDGHRDEGCHWPPGCGYYQRYIQAILAEICDAANLQFLGKAFRVHATAAETTIARVYWEHRLFSRLVAALLIKIPMLWLKVSLLSLSYDTMSRSEFASAMSAIGLSWYGLLQLLPSFVRSAAAAFRVPWQYKSFEPLSVPFLVAFLLLGLASQALRFGGVLFCDDHDFSLYLLECTG